MMNAQGAIVPVADVLEKGGTAFDKSQYLPGIVAYYSTPDGTMLSFPYNSSSPILYYNKDVFQKAGLDIENPPKTWPEVWDAARKIVSSGAATCGYTSTWLTWIHLENFAAWNNQSYATKDNGLGGPDIELKINSPVFVKHMQDIADLAKEGVFRYGGRTSEAKPLFLSGECGIMTESSGGLGDVMKSGVNFATGALPYEPTAEGAPQNTIPGGASLWVFAGHPDEEYKGVASFFNFLSQTDIQSRLHQVSGYLPVTLAAYEATKASGFYEQNPGPRAADHPDDGQGADREFARRARRQPAAAARHPERGVRGHACRTAECAAGARQGGRPRERGDPAGARAVSRLERRFPHPRRRHCRA